MPSVSVCVPAYEAASFVERTVDSVLAQTRDDWELVVVDDASTDGTWDVLQRYTDDPRVRLFRNERNLGAAATWNRVVSLATAPYVKVLCSDDVLRPTCLEQQAQVLDDDRSGRLQLVVARRDIVDAADRVLIAGRGLNGLSGRVDGAAAMRHLVARGTNLFGEPSVTMFRRATLDDVGGFDARWHYMIDLAAYAAVLKRGDLFAIDGTLAAFRVGPHSWSARLAATQGREFRAFIRSVADDPYFAVPSRQRVIGQARATAVAIGRGAVFRWAEWRTGREAAPAAAEFEVAGQRS